MHREQGTHRAGGSFFEHTPPRALRPHELAAILGHVGERQHGCLLIDGREGTEDHVMGSGRLPLDALDAGQPPPVWLLPRRGLPLVVIAGPERARALAAGLAELGWPAWWFEDPVERRWLRDGPPTGALWDIDPFLREQLAALPPASSGPVLDLGCGSAREGVFLAQAGYRVLGIDRLPDALALARQRAALHGVAIETLERRLGDAGDLPQGPFAAVLMFRFWEPELLLGLGRVLLPGAVLVAGNFGVTNDGELPAEAARGPRRDARRVRPATLRDLLDDGWTWIDGPRNEVRDGALWTVGAARWNG